MKFNKLIIFTLLVLVANLAGAQSSAKRGLSLREALQIARDNSYQVLISRSQIEQARGRNLESMSGFLPQVAISENYMKSNDPVMAFGLKLKQGIFTQQDFSLANLNSPDAVGNFSTALQIQQPIFNLDAFYGKSAAALALKAQKASAGRVWQAVALQVKKAYYGLILSRQSLVAIQQAAESARSHRDDARAALNEGLVNQADYLAAEVRLAELQENVIIAKHQVANAGDALKLIIGLETEVEIEPTDSLATPTAATGVSLENITATRSDLRAVRYRAQAAGKQLSMQRSGWVPRLNAFASVEWNAASAFNRDASNWAAGLQLQWQLLAGLGRAGKTKQAAAKNREAEVHYRQAVAHAKLEVRKAQRALKAANERILVAKSAVEQAAESLHIVEARFNQGLEKTSDLLDREVAATNARLRLLKAKHDQNVAAGELHFALGGKTAAQ